MFKISSRVIYSVLFYLLLMILIYVSKPPILFDEKGNVKIFGVGDDKTMFSLGVLTVVIAVLSFYIFCIIDLVFHRSV